MTDNDDARAERGREIEERRKRAALKIGHIMQTGQTMTGRVKHVALNDFREMRFAFITPDDSEIDDLFAHHSEIEPWREGFKELKMGDVVRFKVAKGTGNNNNKWQAVNIEIDREATAKATPFRNQQRGPVRARRDDDDSDNFNR